MKRLFLILLLSPLAVCAQKIPDFGFNKVRISNGDQIIQAEVLPVSSDPKVDPRLFYFWYRANEIHSTQGGFSGKLLNGSYVEYYPDKSLKQQGVFRKGLKNGEWRAWNSDGVLSEIYTWSNGLRCGPFELFDANGKVKQSGKYRNDVLVIDSAHHFWQKINIFKKKKRDSTVKKR